MLRYTFALVATLAGATAVAAQDVPKGLTLRLDEATTSGANSCQVTFMIQNDSPKTIDDISYEMVFLDADGFFLFKTVLPFEKVEAGWMKAVTFNLNQLACEDIRTIFPNKVPSCTLEGGADGNGMCERTDVRLLTAPGVPMTLVGAAPAP